MCLLLLSYNAHPTHRLILAANRDEFYNRPTAPLAFLEDKPDVLAGRDANGGGTWLGLTRSGRFAALTNFRAPGSRAGDAPSRGLLVSDFLASRQSPTEYLTSLHSIGHQYDGFNLLVGDADGLRYYSNREGHIRKVPPGIHGLSNHLLDTPWPKIERGKALLRDRVDGQTEIEPETLFELLEDNVYPPPDRLPDTGVGLPLESALSPLFIPPMLVSGRCYGTRSSSIVLLEHSGKAAFIERTFAPEGKTPKRRDTRRIVFYTNP